MFQNLFPICLKPRILCIHHTGPSITDQPFLAGFKHFSELTGHQLLPKVLLIF